MAKKAPNQQALLTVDDVAQRLNVDPTTVRRWAKNGLLETVYLPHQGKRAGYRFKPEVLDALLNGQANSN